MSHIRLDTRLGPGITPPYTLTHPLLPAGQAEKGHSCLGFKPEGRGEGRASKKEVMSEWQNVPPHRNCLSQFLHPWAKEAFWKVVLGGVARQEQ